MKGYFFENGTIIINRELNELDIFLRDFLNILKRHFNYLVVSGFVSISSGRTRGTEDIDVLFMCSEKSRFKEFLDDAKKNNFWCYQGENYDEIAPYLEHMDSIRFAREGEMFPNIELIPIDESRKAKFFEFKNPQKIKVKEFEFKIPPIEFEILYKEIVLAGKKDMDDALHLRTFFKDILKKEKFDECKKAIMEDYNETKKR